MRSRLFHVKFYLKQKKWKQKVRYNESKNVLKEKTF